MLLLGPLFWGCTTGRAAAQQLAFQSYGEADGLTNAYFSCLHQDRAGFVFTCTEHGLYVFDGRRFSNFGPRQGLPDGSIVTGLTFDVRNRLIVRYPHRVFVSTTPISPEVPPSALVFHDAVSTVGPIPDDGTGQLMPWEGGALFAGQGALYAVHTDAGAERATIGFADGFLRQLPGTLQDPTPLAARGSVLWLVRADGSICGLGTGSVQCFGSSEGLPSDDWVALLLTPDGHVLARSPTRLADIDPGTGHVDVSTLPHQGGRYANYPRSLLLALTPAGHLLTQSDDGLMIRDPSGWRTLNTENGLPPVAILRLMFDQHGDLWLGGNGRGIMRALGYRVWESFDHHDGLSSDMLWQMVRQPGGPLWIASDGGVDAIDTPAGTPSANTASTSHHFGDAAFSVALDTFGHLWRSVGSNAVACITLRTGKTTSYPLPQVSQILRGPGTQLWFVTEKGIYVTDGGPSPTIPWPIASLSGPMTAAAVAADDSLWVLHGQELLHRHADGKVISVRLHWQQPDFEPLTLVVSPGGVIWLAGAGGGGLYRLQLDGDRIVSSIRFQPPDVISNSIVSLLVDHRGWLWAGTDRGVSAFNGQRWVSANMDKGLVWNDQDQGGLLEDADGSMWFATSKGLSHLLKPASLFDAEDLKPVIDSVTVGEAVYRERAVPYTREPFIIQFGALDFRADGLVRFRYRLDGVDRHWADTASGYARYPSVPPGRHRFELVAYDPLTHQESARVSILLRMQAPWWLWWPLLVLYAVTAVGLIYGVVLLRVRILVQQRRALQREVELRTAEIREAQATDSLTRLLTRGEVQARLVRTLAQRDRATQLAIGLLDIDHFKRINDRFGHLAGDEVLKELGRRLKKAFGPGEYAGRYGGEEVLIVLEAARVPETGRIHVLNAAACGTPYGVEGEVIDVTCSIGVAHEHAGDDWKSLIGRADRALYRAKAEGRDRIVLSPPEGAMVAEPVLDIPSPGD